jgi:hypothetical protein
MKKQKKGEITSQQIVILIILIASFAIILFFLFRLNLGEETDKELCRNSVLLKGKSVFKDSTLLNCKRSYVCLSEDGSCEGLTSPKVEKIENKEQAYRILAEEMADCWWMFGEGKVNYVGEDLLKNNYCSICSQFAFDDSVRTENLLGDEIDRQEFYNFLQKNNVSGKDISYLGYLYGIKSIDEIRQELIQQGSNFGSIDLNSQQFVAMGIQSGVTKIGWAGIVGGALTIVGGVAGGIFAAPISGGLSIPISIGVIIGGISGGAAGAAGGGLIAGIIEGESGNNFLVPTIITPQQFGTLNCTEVVTLN